LKQEKIIYITYKYLFASITINRNAILNSSNNVPKYETRPLSQIRRCGHSGNSDRTQLDYTNGERVESVLCSRLTATMAVYALYCMRYRTRVSALPSVLFEPVNRRFRYYFLSRPSRTPYLKARTCYIR